MINQAREKPYLVAKIDGVPLLAGHLSLVGLLFPDLLNSCQQDRLYRFKLGIAVAISAALILYHLSDHLVFAGIINTGQTLHLLGQVTSCQGANHL